jgi:periplasmic divalent cation tolerance protein
VSREIVVFITCPHQKEGQRIGKILVSEKLAACVNIIPGLVSIFNWEGKLNQEKEILLIVKTRSSCFQKLEKRVRQIHSYSVPEVIGLPIVKGSKAYINWLVAMTQGKKAVRKKSKEAKID